MIRSTMASVATQAVFAYAFLLLVLRLRGKEAVRQVTPFDFVFVLVLGDMVDNVVWGEVGVPQFAVAVMALVAAELAVSWVAARRRAIVR